MGQPPSMPGQQPPMVARPPTSMPGQPPMMGQPPSMPGQQPPMGMRPPSMSQPPTMPGPPSMSQPPTMPGPPSMSQPPTMPGPPSMSQPPTMPGPPSMSQPPTMPGPPSMSQPPTMPGPPSMSQPPTMPGPPGMSQPPSMPPGPPTSMSGPPTGNRRRQYASQAFADAASGTMPPGAMPPGVQPGAAAKPQRRGVDPEAVPSPVQVKEQDQQTHASGIFVTGSRANPPLTSTNVRIVDEGNASSRAVRASLNAVPCNSELLNTCKVPLTLSITPLADPGPGEQPVPLVTASPDGPIRCRRCKAYLSTAAKFMDGGRSWRCLFCNTNNSVPDHYFCNLDHLGRRHDLQERPELLRGTIEYAAPAAYCARPPQVPGVLFLLDVSYTAVQSGQVYAACQAIRSTIQSHSESNSPLPYRLGIVTFDQAIHFYNLSADLSQPQMMVVTDVDDVFAPLEKGLVVDAKTSRDVIDALLDQIPQMFASTRITGTAYGAAVRAAIIALKNTGGRVLSFLGTLPEHGPGKLVKREDASLLGTDKENKLLVPGDRYYEDAAKDAVRFGVAFDLFVFPNAYMDLASMAPLATATGGLMHRYPYFRGQTMTEELVADVTRVAIGSFGVEAMLRVRTSTGLRPVEFHGAMTMENSQDVELANVDAKHNITVRIKHDDKIDEGSEAHFQVALLYTTRFGERRIRVHTLSLRTANNLADIFRSADMDSIIVALPKAVSILACYRKRCTSPNTAAGQLILPECLKLMPVYMNCVLRSPALRRGGDMSSDERVFWQHFVRALRPEDLVPFFYPRLFEVSTSEHSEPKEIRCSRRYFKNDSVYVLENTQRIFLFLGSQTPVSWVQAVLGVGSVQAVSSHTLELPQTADAFNMSLREFLQRLRNERGRHMPLIVVKDKDPNELQFNRLLVEDKFNDAQSYVDYLCHIHREIQTMNA
ncbi:uncharacterized protein MONBRDRAFT_38641 [Monosiga brevicollis MX1]|uniref:Uncharacterized protein n=1 Tax=Monosiga brevicollis TaxID=81824 RepID=A9V9J4_MONBE|nr:uncharacterized protein MONBRDRAFT_38641 [Monosiga brevicollis MX1]EDQ85874.1 predicted protein [Monosiga brevicollis MX1]|eukprot:XP_001749353.1 hypothetical protein [Monosiga brevicollis MX1]